MSSLEYLNTSVKKSSLILKSCQSLLPGSPNARGNTKGGMQNIKQKTANINNILFSHHSTLVLRLDFYIQSNFVLSHIRLLGKITNIKDSENRV